MARPGIYRALYDIGWLTISRLEVNQIWTLLAFEAQVEADSYLYHFLRFTFKDIILNI